jgi:hypothetical protein
MRLTLLCEEMSQNVKISKLFVSSVTRFLDILGKLQFKLLLGFIKEKLEAPVNAMRTHQCS